jgi:hypothetical protein
MQNDLRLSNPLDTDIYRSYSNWELARSICEL